MFFVYPTFVGRYHFDISYINNEEYKKMRNQAMRKMKDASGMRKTRQRHVAFDRGSRTISNSIIFDFTDLDGKILRLSLVQDKYV